MSELRQDLVSGDWVLMAPERATRPHDLFKKKESRKVAPKATCPFEDLKKSGNWPPILSWPRGGANSLRGKPDEKNWKITIIPNKYPALTHINGCAMESYRGSYRLKSGVGEHNLLVTRDHRKSFADLNVGEAAMVFRVLQKRYAMFARDKCNSYVSAFFNWGPTAGATVYHPHYQILALPIIPPRIKASLFGAERYYKKHKRCVRCLMIANDKKEKTRIIEENKFAIAVTPFASREPFEIRILPKKHRPYFAKTPLAEIRGVTILLRSVLRRMKKNLNDPDFNFFIHDVPLDYRRYPYHHWHMEVIPKTSTIGGFELSTGIDINVVDPEKAAAILRGDQ